MQIFVVCMHFCVVYGIFVASKQIVVMCKQFCVKCMQICAVTILCGRYALLWCLFSFFGMYADFCGSFFVWCVCTFAGA